MAKPATASYLLDATNTPYGYNNDGAVTIDALTYNITSTTLGFSPTSLTIAGTATTNVSLLSPTGSLISTYNGTFSGGGTKVVTVQNGFIIGVA